MNTGLNIYEKLPKDLQLFTREYYGLIDNRIIERNFKKYNIPIEIKYIILTYLNTNYTFDNDMIYFYFYPLVFMTDNRLQVSLYSWYGCNSPDRYDNIPILHNVFQRPYPIRVERAFGSIAKNIYKDIKYLNFKEDVIEREFTFTGTYGPLNKGLLNEGGVYFNKLSNASWNYKTANVLDYFKQINIIDSSVKNLTPRGITIGIENLKKIISQKVQSSIVKFKDINNDILGPIIKSSSNGEKTIFYKLTKKKSDEQYIVEKNILRQIKLQG